MQVISNVSETPFARFPTVQVGAVQVPAEAAALTKAYPEGKLSITDTPVASLGPLFVTVKVNTIVSPTFGVVLSTVFTISKSVVPPTVGVFVSSSFPGVGSFSFPVTVAVFA